MNRNILRKTLVLGIIVLFIGVGVYPANAENLISSNNIMQDREIEKKEQTEFTSIIDYSVNHDFDTVNYNEYINCEIDGCGVAGFAFFPRVFFRYGKLVNVNLASGFCINFDSYQWWTDVLKINGVEIYDWKYMLVFLYTGSLGNIHHTRTMNVFHMHGVANRAIIY